MAEIDPFVEALVTGFAASPLAYLGQAAMERLDQDEGRVVVEQPSASRRRRLARAHRQLKIVDSAVEDALVRELATTKRLAELAGRLGVRSIGVLPPPSPVDDPGVGRVDQLLDPARAVAIEAFQAVWREAVGEVRLLLELDS